MNKKILTNVAKWVVSIGLIVWLYTTIEWDSFLGIIKNTSPWFVPVGFALILVNNVVCAYKWKLFLKADDLHFGLPYLVKSYWIGFFVSLFLPSNIGGDTYRIFNIGTETKQGVRSFTSVFADRFTGFLALVTIGLVGSIAGYALIHNVTIILTLAAFLSLFGISIFVIFEQKLALKLLRITKVEKIPAISKSYLSFAETMKKYGSQPQLVFQTMVLSFVFHFVYITIVYTYGQFIGIQQPYYIYILFVPIVALVEALPISIYGFGIRDSAYVYLFSLVAVPAEQALALSLVFLITNVLYASLGGLWMLSNPKS